MIKNGKLSRRGKHYQEQDPLMHISQKRFH
ncbi:hypothetical protein Golob_006528 [Gossypium lobatum]|uniref:Uncharacterized protein n=1 Tax=Gossypium lobatum TaxID=34289 RepID=A0A7J8MWW7_9ROSI|nr:hypothetical protein [Gossypium lobatum]